jgi:sugar transferase EpsL
VEQQVILTSGRQRGWAQVVKRTADTLVALVGIVAMSPVLAAVGAVIWATMGGPVLFRQIRPGRYGKPFALWKFRSMTEASNRADRLLDADRLTSVGRFLRASSLDELPQLWNVLQGDLSLVGPRPLLMHYLERYTAEQARRHEVLPGITGWAQVNGRNAIAWEEKFALDVWYVDHWSLLLDVRILVRTLRNVILCEGITGQNHATMQEFLGNGK